GAAALVACRVQPLTREYLFASHVSGERAHGALLRHLGAEPLLDLNLRLGEGTGAALGIGLVEAGVRILKEMATFGEARVSESLAE
ncbi:MAG: nicotinate-nucleotide--dimethylbenzimidazole phosphoribosyltransferase, partial [Gemmatimonadales bacterium]|nr:nicotinate-nucleotide--dimethylbenzimidazole phosphoribosyltransferase [Gemmatimonadales bacterium]